VNFTKLLLFIEQIELLKSKIFLQCMLSVSDFPYMFISVPRKFALP